MMLKSVNGAPHRSHWLQEILPGEQDCPVLVGDERADVVIVGGGLVGLWTALRIKEREPSCDVILLERDVCGGGASGRNGGFVMSWWPKLASLVRLYGRDDAVAIASASESVIAELGQYLDENGIDAGYKQNGWLWTATSKSQVGAWQPVLDFCERVGVEPFTKVSPEEVARRTGSPQHIAGVFEASTATLQPAALVRGLRRVAIERGVRIFEHTHVHRMSRRLPATVFTAGGKVRAEKVVVATNAWAANIPELHTSLLVLSSDMVATPPIPERLKEIGWVGGEGITDSQTMINYYRTTADGRIAFGKGGLDIGFAGRVPASFDHDLGHARLVADEFRRTYPMLADVPLAQAWGGAVDRTPDGLPIMGHLGGRPHLIYGVGWSGNGLAPSMLGGQVLAALALEADDDWSRFPLIDRPRKHFPPEPARFLGAQLVKRAIASKERAEAAGSRPRWTDNMLAKLAPAGVEDKK